MDIDPVLLVEAGIALAGLGVWLLAFWGALLLTRPRPIDAPPPTQDFGGPESPAVVSLITGRWELTEDGAESTLIDLAARKVLEFRQPGNDPLQTTVHVRQERPSGLNAYETMIFERIRGLAVGGMVPLTALTFRDEAEAKGWTRRLNAAIVADARSRGLSRRRFSPTIVTALTVIAAIPSLAAGLAVALHERRTGGDATGAIWVAVFAWAALGIFAGKSRGERDTPQGRAAAARWLGLKTFLRAHESFEDLPPAAVTVWDRYLSYGDAVGATRVCSAVIDLGMGNRRRVWSSFGGTWHRVRVSYPSLFPRYGQKAVPLILKALAGLAVAALVVRFNTIAFDLAPGSVTDWITLAVRVLILWPLLYGGYTLIATLVDLFTPVTLTGEVLWSETWKSRSQGEDSPSIPWLHYLAVDSGASDRTVAWACPSGLAGRASPGDVVTLTARRWTRRVLELRVESSARSGSQSFGDENTDQLIQRAMNAGAPALATAVRPARVSPADLITAEEVGRVLGRPVSVSGGAGHGVAVGPMSMAEFRAADGSALGILVATGIAAELAIRANRGGTAVPGVGDEAFASGKWAVARRGQTVVRIEQRSAGPVHQPYLVWLLGLAVNRLT
ncbi:hypothetical protein ABT297_21085 [Dactylosporangium sp. NPDC000555]|uniref:DUF2207 family protein n=1 Tax=Dactylosporangium sp. NPDC000555 TaxID=3154260 RepID=UPI00332DF84A